jgi:hypothetical protein
VGSVKRGDWATVRGTTTRTADAYGTVSQDVAQLWSQPAAPSLQLSPRNTASLDPGRRFVPHAFPFRVKPFSHSGRPIQHRLPISDLHHKPGWGLRLPSPTIHAKLQRRTFEKHVFGAAFE